MIPANGLWLAPCTHADARHACEAWHYSQRLPAAWRAGRIGVWEHGQFIGAVLFGPGATPNIGKPYGLDQTQVGELVRVALASHQTPVTRIVSIAIRLVQKARPGLRLLVSYADPMQGHHGGIYQGGGWIYAGTTQPDTFFLVKGRLTHRRSIGSLAGGRQTLAWVQANLDPNAEVIKTPGKHRYLMPLDSDMRSRIVNLTQPYPVRVKQATAGNPPDGGGAAPTHTLQSDAA